MLITVPATKEELAVLLYILLMSRTAKRCAVARQLALPIAVASLRPCPLLAVFIILLQAIALLLKHGADPNAADLNKKVPEHRLEIWQKNEEREQAAEARRLERERKEEEEQRKQVQLEVWFSVPFCQR